MNEKDCMRETRFESCLISSFVSKNCKNVIGKWTDLVFFITSLSLVSLGAKCEIILNRSFRPLVEDFPVFFLFVLCICTCDACWVYQRPIEIGNDYGNFVLSLFYRLCCRKQYIIKQDLYGDGDYRRGPAFGPAYYEESTTRQIL